MIIDIACTNSMESHIVPCEPAGGPLVRLVFFQGTRKVFRLTFSREELQEIVAELIHCDENWPTEEPPEAPTAEDERGLNHAH